MLPQGQQEWLNVSDETFFSGKYGAEFGSLQTTLKTAESAPHLPDKVIGSADVGSKVAYLVQCCQ